MELRFKTLKIQVRTLKKLEKVKKLYGFKSLSETIQMLLGHLEVEKILTQQEKEQLAKTNDLIVVGENNGSIN